MPVAFRVPPRWFAAALLAATATLQGSAFADKAQPLARVEGGVRDATGAGLQGADVRLEGPSRRAVKSGPDGQFELTDLAPGDYILTAALEGFSPLRQAVSLGAGQRQTLALRLEVAFRERMVVTASKHGEADVHTTPMAVTVVSGDELQQAQAHTIAQLAGVAPSVTFSQNSDFAQLSIRGVGSNVVFAGSDPSSAVYLDGVYLSRPVMVMGDFLGLDRVEVVRGPQGTLYGRNAVGGAINLVTRPPTSHFELAARVSTGNLDALRTDLHVSGPLVGKTLLASASLVRGVRDGYVRDLEHPDHFLGGEDVFALQGKLHWLFSRRANLLVSADASRQDPIPLTYAKVLQVKPGFTVDNPSDLHEVRASTLAEGHIKQGGAAARLRVSLPDAITLNSLTAYRTLDYRVVNDADITELVLTSVDFRERQHQWSEELTLAGLHNRLQWVAGLFVLDERYREPVAIQVLASRVENRLAARVDATSAAAFGQATIGLTSRLAATAGLRYTRERKDIVNGGEVYTMDLPIQLVPSTTYAYRDSMTHDAWTPKFGLEARVSEHVFAYGSATRGFKSGGFNLTSRQAGLGYAPEWAWSYEAGVKSTFARNRATVNAAVFHMDYSDLQVQSAIRPGLIDISNAADATIRGVEVEGSIRLARNLHAGGHVAWLDATYDKYVAIGVGGVTGDVAGRRLSNAPEWAGRTWLEATGSAGRRVRWSVRADVRSQSTVFFTPFNDGIQRQTPYGLLDLRADAGPMSGAWSIGFWSRNLTNTSYINGSFGTPPPAVGGRPGPSREAGVQLAMRWSR